MLYFFEEYSLDTDRRELRRGDNLLPVEPKVFDLLAHLIGKRDQVVSKEDLIAGVWLGRLVSDSALTSCINAARIAIGDSGELQRLIKTLPRKGVRFVGIVREGDSSAGPVPPSIASASPRPALALPDKPSVAVLPFANLSDDPEQEYFAHGLTEDIITGLSRLRWLQVTASELFVHVQGKRRRCEAGRPRAGCRICLERQRATIEPARADNRAADRCIDGCAGVGRAL